MKFILGVLLAAGALLVHATPPPEHSLRPATLSGSQIESGHVLVDKQTAFVAAIDTGKREGGETGWQRAIPMAPGQHTVLASFSCGWYRAQAEIAIDAAPGHAYRLVASTDAKWHGGNDHCDFRILDLADGTPVGETVRTDIHDRRIHLRRALKDRAGDACRGVLAQAGDARTSAIETADRCGTRRPGRNVRGGAQRASPLRPTLVSRRRNTASTITHSSEAPNASR